MSTDANAALAWPIEITASAVIGDQLVGRKKTPKSVVTLWTYLEMADGKREPGDLQGSQPELCGTTIPGNVRLDCLVTERTIETLAPHHDYPEAGMWWSIPALAWVVRPFLGDWLSDPRVHEEGTETGYWVLTVEAGKLELWEQELLGVDPDNHEAPMGGDGVYVAPADEPEDYDGYVDYVTGRVKEEPDGDPL